MWKVLFLSFFIVSLLSLEAQQPVLYFKRLDYASGLSNNKVNCILQDKRGFTWIGTDDGLNRYDGNNFVVYRNNPADASTISGNTITDLYEDKEGVIWIATTDGGITRHDYRLPPDRKFRQFKHHPGDSTSIPVNIINAIQEDEQGDLWLATSGSAVIKFDKKEEKFLKPDRISPGTVNDISFDQHGMIWAGREGGSILKVDPKTMRWEADPRYSNLYVPLPHMVVTRLFRDSRNNIWFGSWDKALYRFNASTGKEETFKNLKSDTYSFGVDEPISFNEDKKGRIWIGGRYGGLYLFDPATNRFYNYSHNPAQEGSLSDNRVNCIFIDRTGIVWLGTNKGISICQPEQQQFRQEFLPDTKTRIYDFYKDKSGDLWIGTENGIFLRKSDGSIKHKKFIYQGKPLSITKIYLYSEGTFFLGTDYSLFSYDIANEKLSLLPNTDKDEVMKKLIESRVVSLQKDTLDGNPVLWVVPFGHFLAYYDFNEKRWVSRKDSTKKVLNRYAIVDNLIRKIFKTSDGLLWLANAKKGLVCIDKKRDGSITFINNPSVPQSISNNNVYDIKEDAKGNLWISTFGGGLNYFDRKKNRFEHYGSMNNLLEGVAIDRMGNVWAISNGNLQKFDPVIKSFTYFELPDIEKSGGVRGSIYTDDNGKMYLGGNGYFITFEPQYIRAEKQQPEVFLTDFSIFDKSYSHFLNQDRITLKHNQNFFTIEFSAPFYAGSTPVQYSYMLEGVDKNWVNASSSSPQAQYTNLSGGEYIFKVRSTTTPGTWSKKITTIKIRIIPPYWKRGWFFMGLLVVMVTIGYLLYRYRINELLKRQAIRNKIAQDLHDNMGSTLSSISVYSQVAKIYKEKNRQEELQNTLEKISTISGEMISEMNDIVWAINPRNDSMSTILQRMESFARPLLASQGIQFHFSYGSGFQQLNLDMTRRKNFYLIFKESVNNTLKYSEAKNFWVSIRLQNQQLIMTIRDDGKGFDMGKVQLKNSVSLGGNGLKNMAMRAEEAGGELNIISSPGEGTLLTLRMPIP